MPVRRKGRKPLQPAPSGSSTLPPASIDAESRQEPSTNPTPKQPTPPTGSSTICNSTAILNQSSTQAAPCEGGWPRLKAFSRLFEQSTGSLSPLKSVAQAILGCTEIYEKVASGSDEFNNLQLELEGLFQDLQQHFCEYMPQTITLSIESLCKSILKELNNIKNKQARNRMQKYLEAREDSEAVLACYRRIRGHLQRLVLNANISIWRIVDERTTDARLDRLNPSFSARYNSRQATELRRGACTPGTRIDVLAQMHAWVYDLAAGPVYWINGMAGTGKTTIAYSLCDELRIACNLGASFFCSRLLPECRDVNQIVPSIAYQLAEFSRPFRCALARVLEKERNAHTQLLSIQFEMLIMRPLTDALDTLPETLVVVIDALDECDDKQSTGHIIEVLLTKTTHLPIKFLIASRPEPEIREQVKKQGDNRAISRLILHELDKGTVQTDIETYLRDALRPIKPSNEDIMALVRRAGILFIYAATVARYIGYNNFTQNPRKRLKNILNVLAASGNNPYKDIDTLYTLIVDAALNDPNLDEEDKDDRKLVLFTILCAQEPLTINALSGLLSLDDAERVHAALQPLWSVLHIVEPSELVATLHASFPDYMFDPKRSNANYCDPEAQHKTLVRCCFSCISNTGPQFNICGLESSYVPDDKVPNMDTRTTKAISPELLYACRHWMGHIEFARGSRDTIDLLDNFLSVRLLLWMEVMNLKKCMSVGLGMMQRIEQWCKRQACSEQLIQLTEDAWRFVAAFTLNPVSRSTSHIYVSMLPFWPRSTRIGRHYASRMRRPAAWGRCIENRQFALLSIWPTDDLVYSAVWSLDGAWIALIIGGKLKLHDSYSGQLVREPLGQSDIFSLSAAFSPNGTRILSGTTNSNLYMWDTHSGQMVLGPLEGHTAAVSSVAFSANGSYFVSGSRDHTLRVWDAQTGRLALSPLKGHSHWVKSVAFSPDSTRIVSGCREDTIRIWDVKTGQTVVGPLKGCAPSVLFSPDGSLIAFAGAIFRDCICVYDAQTGKPILEPHKGHADWITSIGFSPDGTSIVSGSEDKTVLVWDARDGHIVLGPLEAHNGLISSVAYSPDGTRIASASYDKTVCIWNAKTGQKLLKPIKIQHESITSVFFSPDGTRVASGSFDKFIWLWDTQTGQTVLGPLKGHTGTITTIAFSPDGARIASSSNDMTIRVWDTQTGLMSLGPLKGHTQSVGSVAFSPDGIRIVSSSNDETIRIWDASTGRITLCPLKGHAWPVKSVAFSPDSTRIVSGSDDKTIIVWDAKAGVKVLGPLQGHNGSITSVVFSPEGNRIVSGSTDKTIRVWDAETGQVVLGPLQGHTDAVTSVALSPNGTLIVSGSSDKTVRVWNTQTGRKLGESLKGHTGKVTSVMFSPTGSLVASGSMDKTLRIWDPINEQTMKPSRHRVTWKMRADGWVVSKHTESRLLIWIPVDSRRNIKESSFGSLLWSSDDEFVNLGFEDAWVGQVWSKCYEPPIA